MTPKFMPGMTQNTRQASGFFGVQFDHRNLTSRDAVNRRLCMGLADAITLLDIDHDIENSLLRFWSTLGSLNSVKKLNMLGDKCSGHLRNEADLFGDVARIQVATGHGLPYLTRLDTAAVSILSTFHYGSPGPDCLLSGRADMSNPPILAPYPQAEKPRPAGARKISKVIRRSKHETKSLMLYVLEGPQAEIPKRTRLSVEMRNSRIYSDTCAGHRITPLQTITLAFKQVILSSP
ncbi:hypothetical protein C8F04DRAFT_1332698 [Mycena alexandri]|uniref:Uncharacterized protein n=1 Tax=Mycena alexandri TaxID=1745969 RepID=A0AAD6T3A5_9AGAR|nr:hypothetical protein C8F04DRAFT_1332698 [Mycena alexandri]